MAVEFGLTKLLVPLRSSNSVVLSEAGVDGDGLLVEMTYSISELKPGCWKEVPTSSLWVEKGNNICATLINSEFTWSSLGAINCKHFLAFFLKTMKEIPGLKFIGKSLSSIYFLAVV